MTLQIFTGYKWRPMTAAEIEILTPDRIVAEMTEDAAAGDVYEEDAEMIHELKIQIEYFVAVDTKIKNFEIRKNDRDFKVDDKIILREIDSYGRYTGRSAWRKITYITDYAQQENYVVMAIRELEEETK